LAVKSVPFSVQIAPASLRCIAHIHTRCATQESLQLSHSHNRTANCGFHNQIPVRPCGDKPEIWVVPPFALRGTWDTCRGQGLHGPNSRQRLAPASRSLKAYKINSYDILDLAGATCPREAGLCWAPRASIGFLTVAGVKRMIGSPPTITGQKPIIGQGGRGT
jgi:hypothetical protein